MKTIVTQKVNCKDCHRCVRSCPVKAIGIERGHARLVEDKCILCGKCVVECPQHAKQVETQLDRVKGAIKEGRKVIMSLAPSFIGNFMEYRPEQLLAQIRSLGVAVIEETAIGAEVVSRYYRSFLNVGNKTVISACCPVVVNLIEKYYPQLVDNLAPVVSPMAAHGKLIKQRHGADAFVVFAGPCIAKIAERDKHGADMDAVITFEQLREWLKEAKAEVPFEPVLDEAWDRSRYFPVPGGILKSFMHHDETDTDVIAVDGIEKCMEVFNGLSQQEIAPRFIEALACAGGCVAGPVSGSFSCVPAKKAKVVEFAKRSRASAPHVIPRECEFHFTHENKRVVAPEPDEAQIRAILNQTGKFTVADEKNCGACGYNSCREKAIAVYQGLAETEMCVPYMRSKAESFANIIVDNSLNAIIVVNDKMTIQEFNPAAERMFNKRKEMVKGTSLTEVIDCADFLTVAIAGRKIVGKRVEYPAYGLVTEQMIVPVYEHGLVLGVLTDVTDYEKKAKEIQHMKLETVEKATEIINKQMHVAQEIAGLLGETTAETKSALLELIWLIKGKGDQ
ncbi:pas fold [Lucifera butyrica]|uniref:Pas fold n=1 Tax=Lucifera butyrica TaxID=1351585 RepID=A0A498R5W7_9FIRM|nr:[Fe-Fe] hydrogenase large subunit C-terminal domain-containing protein [Lucifera butyrica]VBB06240.1 pas fold [Lucifera butyrica]